MKKSLIIVLQILAINLAVFSQSNNYNLKFDEKDFSFLETAVGYQIGCKTTELLSFNGYNLACITA